MRRKIIAFTMGLGILLIFALISVQFQKSNNNQDLVIQNAKALAGDPTITIHQLGDQCYACNENYPNQTCMIHADHSVQQGESVYFCCD